MPGSLLTLFWQRMNSLMSSTKILSIRTREELSLLKEAVDILRKGGVVAMPTETVYGLAANAMDGEACGRIYEAKNRPSDNPLIVHISDLDMLPMLTDVSKLSTEVGQIMERFWPGPLTILLPKGERVPKRVLGGEGLQTVAVRMPDHWLARALIRECGFPLAAPSANLSGRPSPTSAEHVYSDLQGRIPLILDDGHRSSVGVESTVLDVHNRLILRPGAVTREMLQSVLPDVEYFSSVEHWGRVDANRPPTPGMKYRHYSPDSPLRLYYNFPPQIINKEVEELENINLKVVRILNERCSENHSNRNELVMYLAEDAKDYGRMAYNLFDVLRRADALHPDIIIAEALPKCSATEAVMNRLEKAASEKRFYEK